MELPPGTVDPLFQHELALELKMTVGELMHGRGTPMSAHELAVCWPAFYAVKAREEKREQDRRRSDQQRSRSRR